MIPGVPFAGTVGRLAGAFAENPVQTARGMFQGIVIGCGIGWIVFGFYGWKLAAKDGEPQAERIYDASDTGIVMGTTSGGNAESGGSSPPASSVNGSTIGEIISQTWPSDLQAHAAAIAYRESTGVTNNVNCWDSNWYAGYPSIGIFQIIVPTAQSVDSSATREMLLDPGYSSQIAYQIYLQQGFGPWTTQAGWEGYTGFEDTPLTANPDNTGWGGHCVYG